MNIPIDPKNWEIITDAMADVVNPGGTAALSHLQGIDFAGKTGSAQTISNALKAKIVRTGKAKFKDNGWFAGVEPRRNPEIVVCVLLEEGEHGYLAARAAAQVIKAYVEKKQRNSERKRLQSRSGQKCGNQADCGRLPGDGDAKRSVAAAAQIFSGVRKSDQKRFPG